ncbi:YceI family protein [Formosa sediminum]|uniref:YceI family protein n=1 Tax=Formosa sediminum TaxID=2594004 RepID=A0A516GMD8_9FLAO|nr:YceI family protein [Formosa sediminum]QDO92669.1 YceI family protein [Formosa sediminum]
MKHTLKTALVLIIAIAFASFTTLKDKKVNVKDSTITWTGHKVTGQHDGTITLKEGTLAFNGNTLVDGAFVMDMTTINTTDLKGNSKTKLDGHLKDDDFFGVNKFPTATLDFTKVEGQGPNYTVTGDLTIKGVTKPITFNMNVVEGTATAAFKIDRTKYGIKYGSSSFFDDLQDKAIYNEFDINATLKF